MNLIKNNNIDFGTVLSESIKNSIQSVLIIGGFVIFFSVVIQTFTLTGIIDKLSYLTVFLIGNINPNAISSLLYGVIEISAGITSISNYENINLIQKLILISLVIGWGGLSVHCQVISIVSKQKLSLKLYFLGKLLHSILSAFYLYLYLIITDKAILVSTLQISKLNLFTHSQWFDNFFMSIFLFSLGVIFIFILVFIHKIKYLLKKILL